MPVNQPKKTLKPIFNKEASEPFIPYGTLAAVDKSSADWILEQSGGRLANVTRMMLNTPNLMREWLCFVLKLLRCSLTPSDMELAICTVVSINGADYALIHHIELYTKAGGTRAKIEALQGCIDGKATAQSVFSEAETAIIRFARDSTLNVYVDDEVRRAALNAVGSAEKFVELSMVVGFYNAMSRFLVATGVSIEGEARV